MYWMAGPWCTEYRGSGVQPTMVLMNAGRAGPIVDFTRDMAMKSKKKTSYPTRKTSSDSLG